MNGFFGQIDIYNPVSAGKRTNIGGTYAKQDCLSPFRSPQGSKILKNAHVKLFRRKFRGNDDINLGRVFPQGDSQILTIADSARNQLLSALFKAVDSVREHKLWGRLKEQSLTNQRKKRYQQQLSNIVEALRERDAHGAERLMRVHLESVRDDMLGK